MHAQEFLNWLLKCERRIQRLYLRLQAREDIAGQLQVLWHRLAEDERRHALLLERSVGLANWQEVRVEVAPHVFQHIEAQITAAEEAAQQAHLSKDDALRHTLMLEGSELNRLDDTWLDSFPQEVSFVLRLMMPEEDTHIRCLIEAVHECSSDKSLQEQATTLWLKQQQRTATTGGKQCQHNSKSKGIGLE